MTPEQIKQLADALALGPRVTTQMAFTIGFYMAMDSEVVKGMAEALKCNIAEENKSWKMMCEVNEEFGMRKPEKLKWVRQAEAALQNYEQSIKTEPTKQ